MSDPTLPPPPSSVPPPPFAPASGFGYSPPPMGPPASAPKKSRTALWIGLGVVAAVGVGAAIWAVTSSSDSETGSVVASSIPLPSAGVERGGVSGWAMTISPDWKDLDFGQAAVEGGWATGGGDASFASNVNVLVEFPAVDPSLAEYMEISVANISDQLDGAVVLSSEVLTVGDQEFGRVEYTGAASGVDGHFVAYVIKTNAGRFVVATFTTLDALFAAEVSQVEPWLATLREK